MMDDARRISVPLDHTRQVTIDALCEHFANDAMTVEDFEARVDVAHRATSIEELRGLLDDLPSGDVPAILDANAVAGRSTLPSISRHSEESAYQVAILGGSRRTGAWRPARVNHAIAIMGGAALDFREAALPPGVTELKVYAVMGGVEVIVPPGLVVESRGIGILGGFDEGEGDSVRPDPTAPVLRVSGIAVMGGVDIHVRRPGESARDARRRRRQERRVERRKELRGRARDFIDDVDRRE